MEPSVDYARLDQAQLFAVLGGQLTVGASGMNDPLRRAFGKAWFEENLQRIRETLCDSKRLTDLREADASPGNLAAAASDLLAAWLHGPPLVTVSWLAIKYGLSKLRQ